jgi:hypothetical protein
MRGKLSFRLGQGTLRTVLFGAIILFITSPGIGESLSSSLFVEIDPTPEAERRLERIGENPVLLRSRIVRVDWDLLLRGDNIMLNLFQDRIHEAVRDRVEIRGENGFSWFGKVLSDPRSSVILTSEGGNVAGYVRHRETVFKIGPLGSNLHVLSEIDTGAFPECAGEEPADFYDREDGKGSFAGAADGTVYIDVMVIYTSLAGSAEGIEAEIQLAIDQTNIAYANSQIAQRLRLAYASEVDYTETGDSYTDLVSLQDPNDGFMDEIHGWRDTCCADVVSLWVDSIGACGRGYLMASPSGGFAPWAFNVVRRDCAVSNISFAHELGHNMGAHHDRANASGEGAYPYSFGYQQPNTFRTVMAYYNGCGFPCPRIEHFSNPDISYEGYPTGVDESSPDSAHNVLTLNNTAAVISGFKDSSFCSSCDGDSFEQDDTAPPSSFIRDGDSQHHNHCQDSSDWLAFGALEGEEYVFETSNLGANSDTLLEIYDEDGGTLLASDDNGGAGLASRLVWSAPATGCYALRISQSDTGYGGDREYDVSLTGVTDDGPCCPDPDLTLQLSEGGAGSILQWNTAQGTAYNVYRGSHAGRFLQYNHECVASSVQSSTFEDPENPGSVGSWFYYVVSAIDRCGEGDHGSDSDGLARPNPSPCP